MTAISRGKAELMAARHGQRGLLAAVAVFSVACNLLLLTGPLYMLQIYDRVLVSRSEPTLVALSALAIGLFVAMGVIDHARSAILSRIGARIQDRLDRRVFTAAHRRLVQNPNDVTALSAQRDLEAIQRLWASPVIGALFDLPWTPLFLGVIFVFHPVLGWLSLAGGAVLVVLTLLNHQLNATPQAQATAKSHEAERQADSMKAESGALLALGMAGSAFDRWRITRQGALALTLAATDRGGGFVAVTKTFRMILQSAILGLGAWLVLRGELGGGAMIAGSILMGRALQPVEQAVSQWAIVTRATDGHRRLATLLSMIPPEVEHTALPRPTAQLEVRALTVVPPGESQPVLRGMTFTLEPGQAVGIIGPSGSGKTTLARALTGIWAPAAGSIRLGGGTPDQYGPDVLGRLIGYLPQAVSLFDGTIAENIARLDPAPDDEAIVRAARQAAAHEMILRLPRGYDTPITQLGGRLSGGQMQRIGLARALYGNPVLLILDEPNANLDNEGTLALNAAIRLHKETGGAVLIMAHRPAAIQECELLLVMEEGTRRAFGPRDTILREMVRNHTEIVRAQGPGGVS